MSTKKDRPSMSFSNVIVVIITISTLIWTDVSGLPLWAEWVRTIFFIGLYCFLALSAGDINKIGDVISYIMIIDAEGDITNREKLLMIKHQLDMFTKLFSDIFTEIRLYVSGKQQFHQTWENIKTIVKRTMKGTITIPQAIWLLAYITYLVIITSNFFNIELPLNIIITVAFYFGLALTSRNIQGLGRLILDLFENVDIEKIDTNTALGNIIHTIKLLCLHYSRIAKKVEASGMSVGEYVYGKPVIKSDEESIEA